MSDTLRNRFNPAPQSTAAAEKFLNDSLIPFQKQSDGTLVVDTHINLSSRNLTELPDLSCVTVRGNFECSSNPLTSLKGAPKQVDGAFICEHTQITSLEGAPETVGGGVNCNNNPNLVSIKGAPRSVGVSFWCVNCKIETLEGAPDYVAQDFWCYQNNISSLVGAPRHIGGEFRCENNPPLKYLEGLSPETRRITSDLGRFDTWNDVPEELRISPETKEAEIERLRAEERARNNVQEKLKKLAEGRRLRFKDEGP